MSVVENDGRPVWARDIEGQVALVTGAGRGLGRACALALSGAGARVIAVARTRSELDSLAAESPGPVEVWVEDVVGDALLSRIEALDRLDVLVNNAGTNRPQPFLEVTDAVLDDMLDLNVRAAFRVARSAARVMMRCGRRLDRQHELADGPRGVSTPYRLLHDQARHRRD